MKLSPFIKSVATPCVLLLALAGCQRRNDSYYPLKEGMTWEYHVSYRSVAADGREQERGGTMRLTNMAPRELKGRRVVPQKAEAGAIAFTFMVEEPEGVYEVARQRPGAVEPEFKQLFYVKYPIYVGANWETQAETVFLASGASLVRTSTIEGTSDSVRVPAATFTECVRVKAVGVARADGAVVDVEVEQWFARGVGLVKTVYRESSPDLRLGSMEMTQLLVSFG